MVKLEKQGAVATLTIDRPESLNALNQDVIIELSNKVKTIAQDEEIQVVKVCGGGEKAFVAGADIAEMQSMDSQDAKLFSYKGQHLFSDIEASSKIFIACVKGFALGGGCELAMACDLIYASDKANFGLPEVSLGLIPGFGGTQRLSRLVGHLKAKELIYTGKMISAEKAQAVGLVNQVFLHETFDRNVDEIVNSILKNGPFAIGQAKKAIMQGQEKEMNDALEVEKQQFAFCFSSPQSKEGMRAFLEKRKPNWKQSA
ncbi:MAG: enoyl-CoA hydratase/isomerase family protein [Deltaproteobacteria bacterium]|nr:enoyl-CoA hydratase/isomerase family protein [Deltaproteobacteria bacterium]